MTDKEDDRAKVRFVFDLFTQIQNLTYKTEAGQEIGQKVTEGITDNN